MGDTKIHYAQVLPRRLSDAFTEARDATKIFDHLNAEHRPTFHSVRALASYLYKLTGYDVETVQQMMARTKSRPSTISGGTTLSGQILI